MARGACDGDILFLEIPVGVGDFKPPLERAVRIIFGRGWEDVVDMRRAWAVFEQDPDIVLERGGAAHGNVGAAEAVFACQRGAESGDAAAFEFKIDAPCAFKRVDDGRFEGVGKGRRLACDVGDGWLQG